MRPGRRFEGLNGTGELEWSHAQGGPAPTALVGLAAPRIEDDPGPPASAFSGSRGRSCCPLLRFLAAARPAPLPPGLLAVHPGCPGPPRVHQGRDLGRLDL